VTLEDDLARLERQVLGIRRVSSFLDAVEGIRRLLDSSPLEVRARVLAMTAPTLGGDLAAAVLAAFDLGVGAGIKAADIDDPGTRPPRELAAAARAAQRDLTKLVGQARTLARGGAEPAALLAPLLGAAAATKRNVTTLVNRAGNEGVVAAGVAAELELVWVAETNACVHCLAYSGRTVVAGKDWPADASYLGSHPYRAPGKCPPLHPNCRCTLEVLNDQGYADALRREADRSVLRGFSLESESMRVRVEAADRLLASGVDVPKSVIAYASRSVRAGKFETRGRPVR
jgi:hypothetical protein